MIRKRHNYIKIARIGSVIMIPLIGNLSDVYGRKAMLVIPLVLSIIPLVVLAWEMTTNFFYAYYAIKTLTAMVTQGGVICLALAYLAENVSEGKRVSAYGVLSGVTSDAYVGGTFAAHFLSTTHIFQVSAAISTLAAIYMVVFLKEMARESDDALDQPILNSTENDNVDNNCKAPKKTGIPTGSEMGASRKNKNLFGNKLEDIQLANLSDSSRSSSPGNSSGSINDVVISDVANTSSLIDVVISDVANTSSLIDVVTDNTLSGPDDHSLVDIDMSHYPEEVAAVDEAGTR